MSKEDRRTNPKGDSDAGLGSKGESVFRAVTLMKSATRGDLTSDADKWVRRMQIVAGVMTKIGDSKKGRAALQEIFYPQRVDREEERDESKLESAIAVEDTQDYVVTPDEPSDDANSRRTGAVGNSPFSYYRDSNGVLTMVADSPKPITEDEIPE